MVASYIQWFFMHFGLVSFILALVLGVFSHQTARAENLLAWMCLLPIGINGLYNFVMHGFFGAMTAAVIGWQNSPFQWEVAVANLGFGLIGLLAFRASFAFRKAVVIANTCWLWGDALGHIEQMLTQHNFAPGNAGSWFWLDVLIPFIMLSCLSKISKPNQIHA